MLFLWASRIWRNLLRSRRTYFWTLLCFRLLNGHYCFGGDNWRSPGVSIFIEVLSSCWSLSRVPTNALHATLRRRFLLTMIKMLRRLPRPTIHGFTSRLPLSFAIHVWCYRYGRPTLHEAFQLTQGSFSKSAWSLSPSTNVKGSRFLHRLWCHLGSLPLNWVTGDLNHYIL